MDRLASMGLACFGRSEMGAQSRRPSPSAAAVIDLARKALQSKSERVMTETCGHIDARLAISHGMSARQRAELLGLRTYLRAAAERLRSVTVRRADTRPVPSTSADEARASALNKSKVAAQRQLELIDAHNVELRRQIAALREQHTPHRSLWQAFLRFRDKAPSSLR